MTTEPDALSPIDRVELVRRLFDMYLERYGTRAMLEMFLEHLGCEECGCAIVNILYPREKYLRQKPTEVTEELKS